jgi:hypothetical protein
MTLAEDWEQLKTELQREADRLAARATGTAIHNRIDSDLAAILNISPPTTEHELDTRRKVFELFRTEWRTSVMENTKFRKQPPTT